MADLEKSYTSGQSGWSHCIWSETILSLIQKCVMLGMFSLLACRKFFHIFFFPSSLKFLNSNTLCWSRNPLVTNTNLLEQRAGLNLKFEEKRGVTHALTDQSKHSYYPKHENLKKMELESVWNGVAATHNSLEEVISELTSVTTPRSNSDWLTSLGSW